VMGIGLGLTFLPLTLVGTTNVGAGDAGLASGLFNTSQQVGGALGLAILSTLAANRTSDRLASLGHAPARSDLAASLVDGYRVGYLVGAAFLLIGILAVLAAIRRRDVAAIEGDLGGASGGGREGARVLEPAFDGE
jgi:hypothetical protein